jgi:DhnA family fructose-bisphosphate aldolase class Ia
LDAPVSGWGKDRRLARLRSPDGVYVWLALDHGLTRGVVEGLADFSPVLALASSSAATGVVVNRGIASSLSSGAHAGLVLQTFGLPAVGGVHEARVPTCRVEDAIRLAADAVAVQLDLNAPRLSDAIRLVSSTISDAAACDLPVLLMMTASEQGDRYVALADALRICTELGIDVIKIALPDDATDMNDDDRVTIGEAIGRSPPTLLCGGERRTDFSARLVVARELGFAGACVGRSVFQAPDPNGVLGMISDVFHARDDVG